MKNPYNIRMRASLMNNHVSGAERIAEADDIVCAVQEMLTRAFSRSPEPDGIVLNCEKVAPHEIKHLAALDVVTLDCADVQSARAAATRILERAGIVSTVAALAVDLLASGASPGGNVMRGAVIMNAANGDRFERDRERGVRASRFDWTDDASREIDRSLTAVGLSHYRTREALALATKVAYAPGVIAELCWSDDPDYTAGYIASRNSGYVRFPFIKDKGDPLGGRVFFIDASRGDLEQCIRYLQYEPVLIANVGQCLGTMSVDEYFNVRKRT